jgi:phosphoglycerate dehydrogenase-like enzyme
MPDLSQVPPGRTVVFCGVRSAASIIRARFPLVEVIDITGDVPTDALGTILFAGSGEPSVQVMSRGVRWVHWVGTGVDGVPAALRQVDQFTISRGSTALAISEYVIATIGAFARNFPDNWLRKQPPQWHYQAAASLAGSTVAVYGFGAIGQRVARLASAFEMSVVALRRSSSPSPIPGVRMASSFNELVDNADHVVLAAPATNQTHHIVNVATLDRMKQGVHLVNVSRGSLVDQEALRSALDSGRIGRASLDVTEPEPLPEGHWIYQHPRVFLTPHSSWVGPSMFSGAIDAFCENLGRYLTGESLHHLVSHDY